jgi:hypothetical protein
MVKPCRGPRSLPWSSFRVLHFKLILRVGTGRCCWFRWQGEVESGARALVGSRPEASPIGFDYPNCP